MPCSAYWTHKYCFFLLLLKCVIKRQNTLGNNTFKIKEKNKTATKKLGTELLLCSQYHFY